MKSKKRVGTVGKAIGCIVLLLISLFPIYWLVAMSIRPTDEMRGHISLIPQSLTGEHFSQLFTTEDFGQAIINSMQTTFGSLIISLLVGICAAYIIARRRFRFGLKKPLTYWVLLALALLNTEDSLTNFGLVAAGGVISVIPITLFVIFAQNYLISGLSSGAVKE